MPIERPQLRKQGLGSEAVFLLPSLKLGSQRRLHLFLKDHLGGYTPQAGNIFGYWRSEGTADSCGRASKVQRLRSRAAGVLESAGDLPRDFDERCITRASAGDFADLSGVRILQQ
jgi:hypothetical protein